MLQSIKNTVQSPTFHKEVQNTTFNTYVQSSFLRCTKAK